MAISCAHAHGSHICHGPACAMIRLSDVRGALGAKARIYDAENDAEDEEEALGLTGVQQPRERCLLATQRDCGQPVVTISLAAAVQTGARRPGSPCSRQHDCWHAYSAH